MEMEGGQEGGSGAGVGGRKRGGAGGARGMSDRCGALDVALRAWALSCRGLGAGADCGLLGGLVSLRAGARLKCLWKSRPGAWRLCSIAILLHVACFL